MHKKFNLFTKIVTSGNKSPGPPQQKVSIDRDKAIIAVTYRGELWKIER